MSTPSNIAAVTLGFRNLLQAALPSQVEVTTLPPAQAGKFVQQAGLLARVNLVCYQVSTNPYHLNTPAARTHPSADRTQLPLALLSLHYLVTVYGTASPEQEQSTERLLEAAYSAIYQKPILGSAELESALPGVAGVRRSMTARITEHSLLLTEVESLFSSMHAVYQPTLAYLVSLSEA